MLSTDALRVNRYILSSNMDQFWLDDNSIIEIIKIDEITDYCVSDAWVHFKEKNGTIFSCRRKEDSYYRLQNIQELLEKYKKKDEDIENILPDGIYNVVDRVSVLSKDVDGSSMICMSIDKNSVEFSSERYAGKIKEKLLFEKPFEKDIKLKIWIEPTFLKEVSKKASNFYIRSHKLESGESTNVLIFFNNEYMQITATSIGEEN